MPNLRLKRPKQPREQLNKPGKCPSVSLPTPPASRRSVTVDSLLPESLMGVELGLPLYI